MTETVGPTYLVIIRKANPNWDEKSGILYCRVEASTKAKAISQVRRQAVDDGHIGFGQGKYWIKAQLENK